MHCIYNKDQYHQNILLELHHIQVKLASLSIGRIFVKKKKKEGGGECPFRGIPTPYQLFVIFFKWNV